MWLTEAVVCLLAAPRVQLFASAGNGWLHDDAAVQAHPWMSPPPNYSNWPSLFRIRGGLHRLCCCSHPTEPAVQLADIYHCLSHQRTPITCHLWDCQEGCWSPVSLTHTTASVFIINHASVSSDSIWFVSPFSSTDNLDSTWVGAQWCWPHHYVASTRA